MCITTNLESNQDHLIKIIYLSYIMNQIRNGIFDYLLSFFFFGEKKTITTCRGDKKFTRVKITCSAQLDNAKHGVYCDGEPAGPPDPPAKLHTLCQIQKTTTSTLSTKLAVTLPPNLDALAFLK